MCCTFRLTSLLTVLITCAFAIHIPAQTSDPKEAPGLLLVETVNIDVANFVSEICSGDPTAAELEAGQCYRIEVTAEGVVSMVVAKKSDCEHRISLDPGRIYSLLDAKIGAWRALARGVFWNVLSSQGMQPRAIGKLIRAVDQFPQQIERIEFVYRGSLEKDLAIDLVLRSRPGTWLQQAVVGLKPDPQGAHLLRAPDSWFSLAVAVQGDGVLKLVEPPAEFFVTVRGRKKAEREIYRQALQERLGQYDGRFSLMLAGPSRYTRLVGVRDGARYAELSQNADVLRFDLARLGEKPAELIAPTALQLGKLGVTRIRTRRELILAEARADRDEGDEDDAMPALETLAKIAGDYSVVAFTRSDGVQFQRLLRRIEAGRVRPMKLLGGALASGEINFSQTPIGQLGDEYLEALAVTEAQQMAEILQDFAAKVPGLILFEIHRDGDALGLEIRGR